MAEEKKKEKGKLENYIKAKNITTKKVLKASTLTMGLALIVFMTMANVIFDPQRVDWFQWMTNTLILIGIMIFGLLMGESIGMDQTKENPTGRYQNNLKIYRDFRNEISPIDLYFPQFYLWFYEQELKRKKVEFLINAGFDGLQARAIVKGVPKYEANKLLAHSDLDEVYVKGKYKILKVHTQEEIDVIKKMYEIRLDAPKYAYFLSALADETEEGQLGKGKKLMKKIKYDRRWNRTLKICSSVFISAVWGMATIKEFSEGQQVAAAMALVARITALITAFLSGYSGSVITVKTEAEIIENKYNVIRTFKNAYDRHEFIIETYEEKIARVEKEQKEREVEAEVVDVPKKEDPLQIEEQPVIITPIVK